MEVVHCVHRGSVSDGDKVEGFPAKVSSSRVLVKMGDTPGGGYSGIEMVVNSNDSKAGKIYFHGKALDDPEVAGKVIDRIVEHASSKGMQELEVTQDSHPNRETVMSNLKAEREGVEVSVSSRGVKTLIDPRKYGKRAPMRKSDTSYDGKEAARKMAMLQIRLAEMGRMGNK